MNSIQKNLSCVNCKQILSTPVLLPCSHLVCERHTGKHGSDVVCGECNSIHVNRGQFSVCQAVENMIKSQVTKIDFGPEHTDANQACSQLKEKLDETSEILHNLELHVHDSIHELKNRITLSSEKLKHKIDERMNKIVDDLDEYFEQCKHNLNSEKFIEVLKDFKSYHEFETSECTKWLDDLNRFGRIDREKWIEIKQHSESALENLKNNFNIFHNKILLGQLKMYTSRARLFDEVILPTCVPIDDVIFDFINS